MNLQRWYSTSAGRGSSDLAPISLPLAVFKKPLVDIKTTGIQLANMTSQWDLSGSWCNTPGSYLR